MIEELPSHFIPFFTFLQSESVSGYFIVNQSAWIVPGRKKKHVNIRLIKKSLFKPFSINTATGGRKIHNKIRTSFLVSIIKLQINKWGQ
ncbi:hypothetical protein H058_16080 [Vibrio antiquarius]|nr:hypothetical protein H058_16080 [Vibrio antiquarius]